MQYIRNIGAIERMSSVVGVKALFRLLHAARVPMLALTCGVITAVIAFNVLTSESEAAPVVTSAPAFGSHASVATGRAVFAFPVPQGQGNPGLVVPGDQISIIGSASARREDPVVLLLQDVSVSAVLGDVQQVLLLDVTLDQAVLLSQVLESGRAYVALEGKGR